MSVLRPPLASLAVPVVLSFLFPLACSSSDGHAPPLSPGTGTGGGGGSGGTSHSDSGAGAGGNVFGDGGRAGGGRAGSGGSAGTGGSGGSGTGGTSATDASVTGDGSVADGSAMEAGVDASDGAAALTAGYGIVYSGWPMGIDLRPSASAAFDGSGRLVRYFASTEEHLAIGSATFRSAGSNGTVAWGTWIGGPTIGSFYAGNPSGAFTFDGTQNGFHHAIGKLATNVPTSGKAKYVLVGATDPTETPSTGPGTFGAVTLVADFGAGTVAVDLGISLVDGPAAIQTTGALVRPEDSEVTITGASFTGSRDFAYGLRGLFIDDGATSAVVSYVVFPTDGVEARGAFAVTKTATPADF